MHANDHSLMYFDLNNQGAHIKDSQIHVCMYACMLECTLVFVPDEFECGVCGSSSCFASLCCVCDTSKSHEKSRKPDFR
jgi:hypothetical protein